MNKKTSGLIKLFMKIAGGILIIVGLITVWMPIPTGLISMAIGLTLLIASSPTIAALARLHRQRNEGLDKHLTRAEPYLPQQMRSVLARTKPHRRRKTDKPASGTPGQTKAV